MRFLVDAQLPARFLAGAGHDAIHTTDLPDGNRTTDVQIARRADASGRIVVTKAAEKLRTRMLADADELKVARTRATVGSLLERWMAQHEVDATTRTSCRTSATCRSCSPLR